MSTTVLFHNTRCLINTYHPNIQSFLFRTIHHSSNYHCNVLTICRHALDGRIYEHHTHALRRSSSHLRTCHHLVCGNTIVPLSHCVLLHSIRHRNSLHLFYFKKNSKKYKTKNAILSKCKNGSYKQERNKKR